MVVSSGDQRSAGWRAERRRVVHVVAQPAIGEPLEIRRLNWPAKGAGSAETDVIGQDQQNIGRTAGRLDTLRKIGRRILDRASDLALECRRGLWQDLLWLLRLRRGCSRRDPRRRDEGSSAEEQRTAPHSFTRVGGSGFTIILAAHNFHPSRTMQRKPTWLVEVSTGSAWRAAGR